jgi:carboxymethylenebutenolidase
VIIESESVDVPLDGAQMRSYLAYPKAEGSWPGIVFYSDIFQLTEPTLRWVRRLAGYGFVVLAPEIYHRIEPAGTVLAFDDPGKDRGQSDADATPVADFDADIRAALDYLRDHPRVAEGQLGAAGHCTGGHLAFRAALQPDVKATACWYATGLHDGKLGKDPDAGTLERAGEIPGELLLVFGIEDPHTPGEGLRRIKAAMDESGTRFEWRLYEAAHAFGRDEGYRYDAEATDEAFAETIALYRRVFGEPARAATAGAVADAGGR